MFIFVIFRILSFHTLPFIPQKKNPHCIFRKLPVHNFPRSAKYPFPAKSALASASWPVRELAIRELSSNHMKYQYNVSLQIFIVLRETRNGFEYA